jgi:hypothetical protein
MTRNYCRLGVLALLIAGGSLLANATTISFSSLSQPGSSFTSEGNTLTQQGFTFADQLDGLGNGLAVWQASSPNLPGLNTANTSLFEFFAGSTTRLTQAGNVAFSLNSIDLAQYNSLQVSGTFNVIFLGTHADNTTVSQTFTVNRFAGTPILQTFVFSNFTNVVRVDFTQGVAPSGTAYQFDNVVVNSTAGVPEPSTFFLGAVSLVVLGANRKLLRRA